MLQALVKIPISITASLLYQDFGGSSRRSGSEIGLAFITADIRKGIIHSAALKARPVNLIGNTRAGNAE
jgi:hypothetical protein